MSSPDSTPAKSNYLKAEEIIGKSVISSNAEIIGTVKGLALSVDGKVGLHVAKKNPTGTSDEDLIIGSDEIQTMGDVILIKTTSANAGKGMAPHPQASQTSIPQVPAPPPPPGVQQQGKRCSRCGYFNGASSKFCIKCGAVLQ